MGSSGTMDFFDPETWNIPAQLAEHWQKIALPVVAVGSAVGSVAKWGLAPLRWAASKAGRFRSTRERADLRFVADDRATFWGIGAIGREKVMSFHGTFHVINLAKLNVTLIKFRFLRFETEHHMLLTAATAKTVRISPQNLIPAGRIGQVEIHCIIKPPVREDRQPFVADVIFTDNLGDEHRVRSVRFNYRGP